MNITKIAYWSSTGLMCLIFALSAGMYLTRTEMVRGFFENIGYPTHLIYPLAIAKIMGIIAVLSNKSGLLKEWAYAGFFFDTCLAIMAHYYAGESYGLPIIAVVAVIVSRILHNKRMTVDG